MFKNGDFVWDIPYRLPPHLNYLICFVVSRQVDACTTLSSIASKRNEGQDY